jgi:hypothetical protein
LKDAVGKKFVHRSGFQSFRFQSFRSSYGRRISNLKPCNLKLTLPHPCLRSRPGRLAGPIA